MPRATMLRPELAVMIVKLVSIVITCLVLELILFASPSTSAYMITSQGYQSDQSQIVYKMPRRHSTKFKVFAECRRDCAGKCNHSLYAYLANKNECFICLLECMSVFTEQAEKMGIRVDSEKTKRRARRVTEFGSPPNSDKKKAALRSSHPIRGYMRTQKK
ncbi:conserved hypothetical protein [Echinococcus multilocularis]|uniref:Uncharacterized protein n=1 Tax=Echinococcus multilocularis TaxID=6211 RepID=A0A068YEQ7_ECHMU|nr:conserved hypothetical protein [Echinococcus multilocularis]